MSKIPPWMIITALMIAFILFMAGCTQLATTDKDLNRWHIHVKGEPDTCEVWVGQKIELVVEDDSLIIESPVGMDGGAE